MPSIFDTIAGLQELKQGGWPNAGNPGEPGRLSELKEFGRNPGALRALLHVPAGLRPRAPLVVVLHGCTQTALRYDRGSGWSTLADQFGFAVLFPEQQRANNPNLCFNWFVPADTRRGEGEAESIREMIAATIRAHDLDAARVFVTGLSAGGAMTSVMLATHPELFAGGAIIAGVPYGTASGVPQAMERMRGMGHDRAALSGHVRRASSHTGPWPAVAVWQGTADATVAPVNAAMIVDQWRGIHGVDAPDVADRVDGHAHRAWHDASGRLVIEEYEVAGLAHGTPIATSGDEAYGVPGAHMLAAGISSTYRIAASWGIVPATAPARRPAPAAAAPHPPARDKPAPAARFDPGQTINDALRAAGLLKS